MKLRGYDGSVPTQRLPPPTRGRRAAARLELLGVGCWLLAVGYSLPYRAIAAGDGWLAVGHCIAMFAETSMHWSLSGVCSSGFSLSPAPRAAKIRMAVEADIKVVIRTLYCQAAGSRAVLGETG
jgi:hypothetical protein